MKTVTLHDKTFRLLLSAADIDRAIAGMAERMNRELRDARPLFLVILNGAFMFASDLIKQITVPGTQISFVKVASYSGTRSSGEVRELIGLNEDLAGRTVVILEDIIDTGRSMAHLLDTCAANTPTASSSPPSSTSRRPPNATYPWTTAASPSATTSSSGAGSTMTGWDATSPTSMY